VKKEKKNEGLGVCGVVALWIVLLGCGDHFVMIVVNGIGECVIHCFAFSLSKSFSFRCHMPCITHKEKFQRGTWHVVAFLVEIVK
jgi:hypothetical protein